MEEEQGTDLNSKIRESCFKCQGMALWPRCHYQEDKTVPVGRGEKEQGARLRVLLVLVDLYMFR